MALSSAAKENIALKKLVGKAHTSNLTEAFAEPKTTGLTQSTSTIFSDSIPESPDSSALYSRTNNVVEYVRLVATPISEGVKDGKQFSFKLSLPSDYHTRDIVPFSNNPKKGTGVFVNNRDLHDSIGKLQLVPPNFGSAYEAKPYYGGDANIKSSGTKIPLLDDRSWYLDYFNGILYQDVPPNDPLPDQDGNQPKNPTFVEAYIYIGTMADTAISSADISSSSIGDLSDVDITSTPPNNDQVLKWNGTNFVPADDDAGGDSFTADTSTLWDLDSNGNLFPHGIIDGTLDTGMFAIELSAGNIEFTNNNTTLDDIVNAIQNINAYTLSDRDQADISDTYWEIDANGNVTPKDAG